MTEPLRVREFRLLLTGFIVGQSMMPLQFVASIAWVQSFADDSVQLILVGAIGTIRGLGMLGFGLFGGALADRFDRRNLLIVTQAAALATNLGIAALMWLGMTDTTGLIIFFLLTLLASAAFALDSPDTTGDRAGNPRPAPHTRRDRAPAGRDAVRDARRNPALRRHDRPARHRQRLRDQRRRTPRRDSSCSR